MYTLLRLQPKNDTQLIFIIWEEFPLNVQQIKLSTQNNHMILTGQWGTRQLYYSSLCNHWVRKTSIRKLGNLPYEWCFLRSQSHSSTSLSLRISFYCHRDGYTQKTVRHKERRSDICEGLVSESFRVGCQEELMTAFMGMEVLVHVIYSES